MNGLARDGMSRDVSRDEILRHDRGQGNIVVFPLQLTTSWLIGNHDDTWLVLLKVMTIYYASASNGRLVVFCFSYDHL